MRILNTDFKEGLDWTEESVLAILERTNKLDKKELKKAIKESGLCKTITKSKKRKSVDASNIRNADNVQ